MELPLTDKLTSHHLDALYSYTHFTPSNQPPSHSGDHASKPWVLDPHYFKTVRISPVALLKMVMHARSGGSLEVMGMMQGFVDRSTFVVTDAFRLPVEGTETRVNAQGEADEYLVQYLSGCREESRQENVVGWYHSHPGYGCWLSGIDVETQKLQQLQGPMVAIVVDPDRTVAGGKVDIGAFRTYPENYSPPGVGATGTGGGDKSVPLGKMEDFGAHASKYYALEVEHFKSTLDNKLLDALWNKYWVGTLAGNPLLTNRDFASSQMRDLGGKVREFVGPGVAGDRLSGGSARRAALSGLVSGGGGGSSSSSGHKGKSQELEKIARDVGQVAVKERAGLMAAEVKESIFGGLRERAKMGGCGGVSMSEVVRKEGR
ncbi:JAB1/Mov34/MPN/PAD-1 ubiquitin protease-domain-containing protein [Apiosordaria backusii]|uniref:COP9 signalosome complex subunit 5 n=1 Tax=Apiosordaria backusii TaxID=314023 RepID=A0AA40EEF9_9PEZI|nr:JAB1/Mov34/MPN/PAD-1 ubiquitin protease-domain-containing protein [Apiosordaria backusii]